MSEQRKPVALIIGMGRGLSAALAMRFAQGGFAIAGFARNPDASAELAATMAERGHQVVLRAVDASDAGSLTQAIAAIEAELGPVEVLIYNAYRATIGLPSEVPVDQVVEDFRVNVAGALAAIHAVLPGMRQRGKGSILLTGGGLALDPTGWLPAASLARFGFGIISSVARRRKQAHPPKTSRIRRCRTKPRRDARLQAKPQHPPPPCLLPQ